MKHPIYVLAYTLRVNNVLRDYWERHETLQSAMNAYNTVTQGTICWDCVSASVSMELESTEK